MSATCPRCGAEAGQDARFCQICGATIGDGESNLIGKVLGRKYRVIDQIGEGSMGRIYRAEHLGLEKRVALKVLHREVVLGTEGLQRFRREGVAAGKLSHPNAIEVYDFDVTESGDAFLAMEFIEGRDLRRVLEEGGPLDLDDARDIVLQALDALAHAHASGIVHRDLKPENIMIIDDPGGPRVKVLDFGLSKLVDTRVEASLATVPGRIIGTPFYMAPEQSSGEEADARTDLYAMGVIFFELLVGQRPFSGRTLTELLYAQATQDVPSAVLLANELGLEDLPDWVDDFVERALERDRDDRYQGAEDMAQDLRDEEVDARDATPREKSAPVPQRASGLGGEGLQSASRSANRSGLRGGSRFGSSGATRARRGEPASRPKWLLPALGLAGAAALFVVVVLLQGNGTPPTDRESGGAGGAPDAATLSGTKPVRIRQRALADRTPADQSYVTFLDSARAQVAGGNLEGAAALVSTLMALPQRDPEAYLVRASLSAALGDLDAAASDLRAAIDEDPTYAEARTQFGWLEFDRSRSDAALVLFDAVLAEDEDSAEALAGRAAVLADRGDTAEADALLERAIAANRDAWRAHLARARIAAAAGDFEAAITSYVEAKRVQPQSGEIVLGLARAYLAAGRVDDAIPQYRAALEGAQGSAPERAEVLRGLTAAYLAAESFGDAARLLGPKAAAGVLDGDLKALLGLARHDLGEIDGALRALRDARIAGVSDPRPLVLLAALDLQSNDPAAAMAAASAALELDEALPEAHLARGLALFRFERYEAAEVALRRAVELDGECLGALLVLGDLGTNYLADGARAADDLRAYLEAGGRDPRAAEWLAALGAR